MKQIALVALLALFGTILPSPSPVKAAEFNIHFVITDTEFIDKGSMSVSKIQEFLNYHGGVLRNYSELQADGSRKSAAQIIYDASTNNRYNTDDYPPVAISPKVILTTLQKEEGLITPFPDYFTQERINNRILVAMGYGYPENQTWSGFLQSGYAGFSTQVHYGARSLWRNYYRAKTQGYTWTGWPANGQTRFIDCYSSDYNSLTGERFCELGQKIGITPVNPSTAALYTYTPHPGGNFRFWKIWRDFNFDYMLRFPNGTIVRAKGTNDIYLIQNGLKRKFASTAAFRSRFSNATPVTVNADQLFFYENGKEIKFANYSLLVAPKNRGGNGRIYLLVNDTLRHITSPEVFRNAGFQLSEVVRVNPSDLADYDIGVAVTAESLYPSGRLLQYKGKRGDPKNGMVYFVQDGIRHGIPSKGVLRSQFGKRKSIVASPAELDRFTEGPVLGFKDGTLVSLKRGSPVYFISNGNKLPIGSWDAMKAYGFDKLPIVYTNQRSLDVHPTGAKLTGEPMPVTVTP